MNNKGVGLVEILLGILLACLVIFLLSACEEVETEPTLSTVRVEYSDFNLKADEKTGVIYIDNSIYTGTSANPGKTYHIYTPYYSENGKLCRWVDGKVVEVDVQGND